MTYIRKTGYYFFALLRLSSQFDLHDKSITFQRPAFLWVPSPVVRILEFFASHIQKLLPEKELLKAENWMHFKIWPEKISERTHHIHSFKDAVTIAWSCIYRIERSEEPRRVAFDCGLNAKNNQGFGITEKYE